MTSDSKKIEEFEKFIKNGQPKLKVGSLVKINIPMYGIVKNIREKKVSVVCNDVVCELGCSLGCNIGHDFSKSNVIVLK